MTPGGGTPNIPNDLMNAVLVSVQERIAKRIQEYDAKVMAITETGPQSGMIQVFCQALFTSSTVGDQTSWRPAWPHDLYAHRTPDVGDIVKVKYKNFLDDDLEY